MLKKFLIFVSSLLLIFPSSPFSMTVQGGAKRIIAIGVADGNSSRSRDEAMDDALRKAVGQGVGTFVTTELSVEQQTLVEERIYTATQGYIQSYEVIGEGPKEDIYEVKISALVKMGKLGDDLQSIGLLIRKKRNPRVMVVVYSKEINSKFLGVGLDGTRNVENQMEGGLKEMGFQLVDADQTMRNKEVETLFLEADPSSASKISRDLGAEILINGEVRRTFVGERQVLGRPTRFFSNEIRVKALETDSGKVLFSGYKTRPPSGAGALLPLEDATSELIDEMAAGILEKWRKDVFQAGSYRLSLSKVSLHGISRFKEGLRNIRGVHDIQVRSFQSGYALFEVEYRGSVEELAENIDEMKNPALEITGMQSNTIEIKIRK